MIRFRNLAMLFSLAFTTLRGLDCQAQSAVDCLFYPLFDCGGGVTLYDADYYGNRNCASGCHCTGGPLEEYLFEATGEATPQACAQCVPTFSSGFTSVDPVNPTPADAPSLKGVEKGLVKPLHEKFKFGENLQPYQYADASGTLHTVDPKKGFRVLLTKWVNLETNSGQTIPVKLYAVEYDLRRAGLPPEAYVGRSPVRNTQIGFEFANMPKSEAVSAPTVSANQISIYKNTTYVNLDSTIGNFLVLTSTPVF